MHELVIRNGTVVDGTGRTAFEGDIAVDQGRITQVGGTMGRGAAEIDATNRLVTPGWVDIHSHMDGQVMWDPLLSPSAQHGVSTIVMGHCGVGFAPVHSDHHEKLISIMEGLEEIPAATLRAGLGWRWQSFADYLDVLSGLQRAADFATQIPHSALRMYCMAERGAQKAPATPEDIRSMAAVVEEALRAGALGFTTSRTRLHQTSDGKHIPGSFATREELLGIGEAFGRAGHGVFQMMSDFEMPEQEFEWMTTLSREQNVPVHFLLSPLDAAKREVLLQHMALADDQGAEILGLVGGRAIGMVMTLDSDIHPLAHHPSYLQIAGQPLAERVRIMRDPAFRQRLLGEANTNTHKFWKMRMGMFETMYRLGTPPNFEPAADESIAAIAARTGQAPEAVIYDMLLEKDGTEVVYNPLYCYSTNCLAPFEQMLQNDRIIMSLADGGAHLAYITDASMPTFMLTHWVRDRTRGPKLPLEKIVHMQTRRTADAYGLHDRGSLLPGFKADINVIDFDRLQLGSPYWQSDLPAGGRRLVQDASGYDATIVSGVVTARHGEPTGALPGRLIRGPQSRPMAG